MEVATIARVLAAGERSAAAGTGSLRSDAAAGNISSRIVTGEAGA
jgi:hypothetical protein